jgi:predicted nuclease of predicted toxin-antitoxin system
LKILFDHNLSQKLVRRLADVFPDSTQTSLLGFNRAIDLDIWEYARTNDFVVVTLDKDFADMSFVRGAPPKVIWLRCGNSAVSEVEALLRANLDAIREFENRADSGLLEIWP